MITLTFRSSIWPRRRKSFHQKLYSRHSAGLILQTGRGERQTARAPTTRRSPLDFISRTEEPRLLLIVPEHACRCGYSRCRGFIAPKYASDAKVDGEEALHLPYLYYFLRSDAKTSFGRCVLSAALHLMMLQMTACTLGASVIP